jgi:hypothetical protein
MKMNFLNISGKYEYVYLNNKSLLRVFSSE